MTNNVDETGEGIVLKHGFAPSELCWRHQSWVNEEGTTSRIDGVAASGPVVFRPNLSAFVVEEVPRYRPSGNGDHAYLFVEKTGVGTPSLVRALSRVYNVKPRDVGIAGRKDAFGTTRQWISFPKRALTDDGKSLEGAGPFRVLECSTHTNKLKLGHLLCNRFYVGVEGDTLGPDEILARGKRLETLGVPNYFGAQRFGRDDTNIAQAFEIAKRGVPSRSPNERFLRDVIQSVGFNQWLRDRMTADVDKNIEGELLSKWNGRKLIRHAEIAQRADETAAEGFPLRPTGPLVGREMRVPDLAALTFESRSLSKRALALHQISENRFFDGGDRRNALAYPGEVNVSGERTQLSVQFTLPRGAYASVFMHELLGHRAVDGALSAELDAVSVGAQVSDDDG